MSGSVLTYDPTSVTIIIAGYILTGVTSVSLEWKSVPFRVQKGIRGINTRIYNQDRHATLNIDLLQTSISNDVLSQIIQQDAAFKSGRLEVSVKDVKGTTHFTATNTFVAGWPNVTFDKEGIENRRWQIEILSFVQGNVGGNAQNGVDINDILNGAIPDAIDSITGFFR